MPLRRQAQVPSPRGLHPSAQTPQPPIHDSPSRRPPVALLLLSTPPAAWVGGGGGAPGGPLSGGAW
eukprot:6384032-Pyramimonas_sp.AAC.1